jgi:CHASE3 domain sensor protein
VRRVLAKTTQRTVNLVMTYLLIVLIVVMGIGFFWSTIEITSELRSVKDELKDVNNALHALYGRLIEIRDGENVREED